MSRPEIPLDHLDGFPSEDYVKLLMGAFPEEDPQESVLGITDEVEIAPTLYALLEDSSVIVSSIEENGQLIGCSIAMPIDKMDPSREAEASDTAYIYYTAVEPSRQGEGLVAKVNDSMINKLKKQGYSYVEQDNVIANGYANKIKKNYNSSIVDSYEHSSFPEVGPEVFVRIKLGEIAISEPK